MADGDTTTQTDPNASPQDMSPAESGLIQQLHKNLGDVNPPKATLVDPHPDQQGDEMLKEGLKIYERDRQRSEEANAQYEHLHGQIDEINKRLQTEPNPTPPTPRAYPEQPDPAKQKATVGQLFGQIMSLVAIGSAVFGKHRGAYGRANAMAGAGAFLKAFAQGQRQQGQEQLQNWNKSVELTSKLNAEDRASYNEILANKRLDLQQQMDLLRTVAAQRQDSAMYSAAASRDLNGVMKVMSNKLKAQVAFTKAQHSINQTAMNNWMEKTTQGRTWAAFVQSKTATKDNPNGIDPHKDYESFVKANELFPASDWIAEHTKNQKDEGEGEKLKPGTKKAPNGQTVATDTQLTPDQARSMLKSGDYFIGTNNKFYQVP